MVSLPKGWGGIEEQTQATAMARQRAQETFLPELRVNQKNPGPYVIRLLEQGQDVNNYAVHEYKEPGQNGQFFNRRFTCSAQAPWNIDCAGCRASMKRKTRGVFNLIQRGRPVFRKDNEGKAMKDGAGNYYVDGYADTVVIASVGGPTAEMLRLADGQYQGLMSRDFVVAYSGDTFQAWNLAPAIDQQGNAMAAPMSDADFQLAASKFDLDRYMAPPTQQEAAQIIQRFGANSGASQQGQRPPQQQGAAPQGNQFLGGVDPARMAAAGVNSFGLATGQQSQQPPAQPQPVAQQPAPVAPQPPQQPTYQPPPVQPAPVQQQPQQAWQPTQVGVPAAAAPPIQQPHQPQPPVQPIQQQQPTPPIQTQQFS